MKTKVKIKQAVNTIQPPNYAEQWLKHKVERVQMWRNFRRYLWSALGYSILGLFFGLVILGIGYICSSVCSDFSDLKAASAKIETLQAKLAEMQGDQWNQFQFYQRKCDALEIRIVKLETGKEDKQLPKTPVPRLIFDDEPVRQVLPALWTNASRRDLTNSVSIDAGPATMTNGIFYGITNNAGHWLSR